MLTFMNPFFKAVDRLSAILAQLSSITIIALMLLIPFEVIMRYIFNSPTIWSSEVSQFILCALIAFGGAKTLRDGHHVNVDIVYGRLSVRGQAIVNLFTYLILFFFIGMLVWKSWGVAVRSFNWGETSSSSFDPPIWPFKVFYSNRSRGSFTPGRSSVYPIHYPGNYRNRAGLALG